MTSKITRTLTAAAAAAAITVCGAVAPANAEAKSRLKCTATVSDRHPHQNSTVIVVVHTRSKSSVRTTAHYKTTDTPHAARANSKGLAAIDYRISRATKGWKVKISVVVKRKGKSGSCSTSFTPR